MGRISTFARAHADHATAAAGRRLARASAFDERRVWLRGAPAEPLGPPFSQAPGTEGRQKCSMENCCTRR
eukprot:2964297-Pyramimonas_sp.AAC.1